MSTLSHLSTVERVELVVKQFNMATLLLVPPENVEVFVHHRIEYMAYELKAQLLVPSKVLQQGRIVCEYPSDWWQAIKARLGWKHRTRMHLIDEYLLFPKIPVPAWAGEGSLVPVHYYKPRSQFRYDGEIEP